MPQTGGRRTPLSHEMRIEGWILSLESQAQTLLSSVEMDGRSVGDEEQPVGEMLSAKERVELGLKSLQLMGRFIELKHHLSTATANEGDDELRSERACLGEIVQSTLAKRSDAQVLSLPANESVPDGED